MSLLGPPERPAEECAAHQDRLSRAATVWRWKMNSSAPTGTGSAWSFSKTVWFERATQRPARLTMQFGRHDDAVRLWGACLRPILGNTKIRVPKYKQPATLKRPSRHSPNRTTVIHFSSKVRPRRAYAQRSVAYRLDIPTFQIEIFVAASRVAEALGSTPTGPQGSTAQNASQSRRALF